MASYKIDNETKTIYADIATISNEDWEIVLRCQQIGYKVVNKKIRTRKTVNKNNSKKNRPTNAEMKAYLDEHGTEEQKAKYNELYTTIKPGKARPGGYLAAVQYFLKEFPDYNK